jgi:hypothetical protein
MGCTPASDHLTDLASLDHSHASNSASRHAKGVGGLVVRPPKRGIFDVSTLFPIQSIS